MNPIRKEQGIKRALRVAKAFRAMNPNSRHTFDKGTSWFQSMSITRSPCSCYMCGNPRQHFGELTMQEKKANESLSEEISDISTIRMDDWEDEMLLSNRNIEEIDGPLPQEMIDAIEQIGIAAEKYIDEEFLSKVKTVTNIRDLTNE